jgi:hypothetical protein
MFEVFNLLTGRMEGLLFLHDLLRGGGDCTVILLTGSINAVLVLGPGSINVVLLESNTGGDDGDVDVLVGGIAERGLFANGGRDSGSS